MTGMASPPSSSVSAASNDLLEAVSRFLETASSGSLRVSVSLSDSDEMEALKSEVRALQASLQVERDIRNRAERLAAESTHKFLELLDLCRVHDVPLPSHYAPGRRR